MDYAPIALFAYNRPEHLHRTVIALKANPQAAHSELHVFCDAARKPKDVDAVAAVRRYVRTINGFLSVKVTEREQNFGLSQSIHQGVTQLCEEHGRAIILEDDLLVASGFLEFMNASLARYANEDSVMQVSGYQFPGCFGHGHEAIFLPLISCWGWATWARAWRHYDPQGKGAERLDEDGALRERFNLDGAYDYYEMLQDQREGRISSWGIRWLLNVFLMDGLVLYPPVTLVQNIGVDGSGTHGRGVQTLQSGLTDAAPSNWCFPLHNEVDDDAVAAVQRLLRAQRPSLLRRITRKVIS